MKATRVTSTKLLDLSNNLLAELTELIEKCPDAVAKSLHNFVSFQSNSNHHASWFVKQKDFIEKLISKLRKGEQVEELKWIAGSLISAENFDIFVHGDFENLPEGDLLDPWTTLAAALPGQLRFLTLDILLSERIL